MALTRRLSKETAHLVERMLDGDVRPLARLISIVEGESPESAAILHGVSPSCKAYRVGVTGPPGAGKSTLVARLISLARRDGLSVGVICADPSSPFSGGAVLGDRVRMQEHYLDEGVYIRSMSTRGSTGGLPDTVTGVIKLIDAYGKDIIFVETVGVGQTELDVMDNVDTVVVVLVPEGGDSIQAMKAGLMEIADVFTVNKSDRPGSEALVIEVQTMLELNTPSGCWKPPVLATQAENNVGIAELYGQIKMHRESMIESGQLEARRARQRRNEFVALLQKMVKAQLAKSTLSDRRLAKYVAGLDKGNVSPYEAAEEVYSTLFGKTGKSR